MTLLFASRIKNISYCLFIGRWTLPSVGAAPNRGTGACGKNTAHRLKLVEIAEEMPIVSLARDQGNHQLAELCDSADFIERELVGD